MGEHLTPPIQPPAGNDNGPLDEFEALYQRYFARLVHDLRRRVPNRATAEDLAQETLLRAFVKLDRYDPSRPLWPWIRAISRRILVDHGPRLSPEVPVVSPESVQLPAELSRVEDRAVLAAALARLQPRHREAVGLRYVADWEPRRAAAFLGVSVAAFNQLLFRARERLREEYQRMTDGVPILVALRCYRARMRGIVRRVRRSAAELTRLPFAEPVSSLGGSAGILLLLALIQPLGVGAPPAQADAGPGLVPRLAPMPSEETPVTPQGTPPADGKEQRPSGGGMPPEPPAGEPPEAPTEGGATDSAPPSGLSPEDAAQVTAPVASDAAKVNSPAGSNVVSFYPGDPIPIPIPVPVPEPLPVPDPGPIPESP